MAIITSRCMMKRENACRNSNYSRREEQNIIPYGFFDEHHIIKLHANRSLLELVNNISVLCCNVVVCFVPSILRIVTVDDE